VTTSVPRQGGRVVVWSHDPALAEACRAEGIGPPERVASAYEAAAELLAGPAGAVVIDLSQLRRAHLPLLEIARERQTEVIGVGALGDELTSEELSGVRLAGRSELPALLAAAPAAGESAQLPEEPEPGAVASEPGAGPAQLGPDEVQAAGPDDTKAGAFRSKARPAESKTSRREPAPADPSALLTAEELAALLEDAS